MVCITSAPTADLFVFVPGPIAGGGWAWTEHARFAGVLASEYVYSAREAVALVRAYGTTMARLIRPFEAERFTVLARGRVTGMLLARDEWEWSHGVFEPTGEPWETWREAARKYFDLTGRRIERQRFRADLSSTLNGIPNQPHVRSKEDVPHEHALPDLYGLRRLRSA
ncbi:hypothetical protein ACQEV9_15450 [Streptomyces chartreusis]|uniref:hypothetical protein n=1 Tax=Streptomyces chartreusis TaxID=1969 RepID=UPI003D912634